MKSSKRTTLATPKAVNHAKMNSFVTDCKSNIQFSSMFWIKSSQLCKADKSKLPCTSGENGEKNLLR